MNKSPQCFILGVPLDLFPGKSNEAKRMNATLIKRSSYQPKYAACYGLEGEALKQELLKARAILQGRTERGLTNTYERLAKTNSSAPLTHPTGGAC